MLINVKYRNEINNISEEKSFRIKTPVCELVSDQKVLEQATLDK